MKWLLLVLLFGPFIIATPLIILSRRYRNPYKLYYVFGKKGAGKSTMLTKLAFKYNKKGIPVYCNVETPGTILFDARKDFGFKAFPPGSVIMIDEVSLLWDNRNFKNFKPEVGKYFRLQRHHQVTIWLFSQTFDVDRKVRDQCDRMFMLQNFGGWLSYCKEIRRKLVVVEPTDTSEARIADTLIIPPWFTAIFGTRKFIFIPRWSKYFNTRILDEELPPVSGKWQPYTRGRDPRPKRDTKVLTKVKTSDKLVTSQQGGVTDGTEKEADVVSV